MEEQPWHLSKTMPVSFILAIITQTVALVWFVAALNSGVQANAKEIVRHDTRIETLQQIVQGQAVALGRMDENIKAIRKAVEQMASPK
jgi:type VI protein secretion system component VasK